MVFLLDNSKSPHYLKKRKTSLVQCIILHSNDYENLSMDKKYNFGCKIVQSQNKIPTGKLLQDNFHPNMPMLKNCIQEHPSVELNSLSKLLDLCFLLTGFLFFPELAT